MINDWRTFSTTKKISKLHERILKGIPDSIRPTAWRLIIDPDTQHINFEDRPSVESYVSLGRLKCCDIIEVDLDRTLPQVEMFANKSVKNSLRNILQGYSNADPELGYTQGMAFSAGMLLSYMDEYTAFWCFHKLMSSPRYGFREYFLQGFPKLISINKVWDVILKQKYLKIALHCQKEGIDYMVYTPSWFLTAFLNLSFPPVFKLMLFDRYITFGSRSLLSFGLVIISRHKDLLLKLPFEELLPILQKPNESERMFDWRYVIKKWDEHWISEKDYKNYFIKAGVNYFP